MKKPEWMNKKYWIFYFIFVPCFWIFYFGSNYYKKTHPKTPEMISALDIKEGDFDLFSETQKICGNIKIQHELNQSIIVTVTGDEIIGKNIINKEYKLQPVSYTNIKMEPTTTNHETYYLYDTGSAYIMLLKIRKNNYYLLENYDRKTNVDLYVLKEISYEKYEHMIDFSNNMELHENACVSIDTSRYTCFFEQENIPRKKFITFAK